MPIRPETSFEVVKLFNDVTTLATDMLARPLGNNEERIARVRVLDERLCSAIASARGLEKLRLDNFAPLMIEALGRLLDRRRYCDEPGADDWEAIVGHLLPKVRADARATLESMKG